MAHRNALPADTTIHWHGIRIDPRMNGALLDDWLDGIGGTPDDALRRLMRTMCPIAHIVRDTLAWFSWQQTSSRSRRYGRARARSGSSRS
ncbi:hypothetical protein [Nonomuraea polychroma]|uniref:hypothetical protein n=1 Tax=Nonomuraea polychroma TaxID=46176 RepID=UPI0013E3700C|nr:hypothetical protein [Nonomuraea polychroma]